MERIPTGISGLDEFIGGGLIRGSTNLLKGPSGVGKSVMGLQFLYAGAVDYGENGLMIQVHGYPTDIEWYQSAFGWDFSKLSEEGKVIFTAFSPSDLSKFELRTLHSDVILQLYKIIGEVKAKRIVFDSITPVGFSFSERREYRNVIYLLSKALKEKGCTSIFISECDPDGKSFFPEEDFVFDSVFRLSRTREKGQVITQLHVDKMVASDPVKQPLPVDITDSGMIVIPPF